MFHCSLLLSLIVVPPLSQIMKKYYDYSFELALSRIYMCFYSDSWGTYIVLSGNMDIPRTPILTCQPDYLEWFMKITVTPTRQNYSRYERKVIFHRLISLQFGSNEKKNYIYPSFSMSLVHIPYTLAYHQAGLTTLTTFAYCTSRRLTENQEKIIMKFSSKKGLK